MPHPNLNPSRHRLEAIAALAPRLTALLDTLDIIDRTLPLPPDLVTSVRRTFVEARHLLGETAFQPLPGANAVMPGQLLVTTLEALLAAKALFHHANIAAMRKNPKIYPRRLQQA